MADRGGELSDRREALALHQLLASFAELFQRRDKVALGQFPAFVGQHNPPGANANKHQ